MNYAEAIDFLKDLNRNLFSKYDNIFMVAEEATSFPKVTGRADEGGLWSHAPARAQRHPPR